jgi:hypothetical protein
VLFDFLNCASVRLDPPNRGPGRAIDAQRWSVNGTGGRPAAKSALVFTTAKYQRLNMRAAMRGAVQSLIEQAIKEFLAGHPDWCGPAADLSRPRSLRDSCGVHRIGVSAPGAGGAGAVIEPAEQVGRLAGDEDEDLARAEAKDFVAGEKGPAGAMLAAAGVTPAGSNGASTDREPVGASKTIVVCPMVLLMMRAVS